MPRLRSRARARSSAATQAVTAAVVMTLVMTLVLALPGPLRAQSPGPPAAAQASDGAWTVVDGARGIGRDVATATLLADGRILVAGGRQPVRYAGTTQLAVYASATTGIWDPANARWTEQPDMPFSHARASDVRLEDGRVMVVGGSTLFAGGYSIDAATSALLFDPDRGRWTVGDPLSSTRDGGSAVALADGSVLALGGTLLERHDGSIRSPGPQTERWIPGTGRWKRQSDLGQARYDASASLLADGRVLVAGGEGLRRTLDSSEVFDPGTSAWSAAASMGLARARHQALVLRDGRVLVVGGAGFDGYTASAELYDPIADTWSSAGSLSSPRDRFALVLLPDGRAVAIGGGGPDASGRYTAQAAVDIFDPATATWTPAAALPAPRWAPSAVTLDDGTIVVIGGAVSVDTDPNLKDWPNTVLTFVPPTQSGG